MKFNANAFFLYRLVFIKPVLIKLVITSAVSPTPVNMEARVMKCVTSQREDSTAHVQQVSVDSSVKLCPRWNHAETSCCLRKPNPMVSTTLLTKTTFRSQFIATLVLRLVWHGLWSSPTHSKTMAPSQTNHSTCTTCQSTKIHLNGVATVCRCPVWSQSETSPLTGEPLVIFLQMGWTTGITGKFL